MTLPEFLTKYNTRFADNDFFRIGEKDFRDFSADIIALFKRGPNYQFGGPFLVRVFSVAQKESVDDSCLEEIPLELLCLGCPVHVEKNAEAGWWWPVYDPAAPSTSPKIAQDGRFRDGKTVRYKWVKEGSQEAADDAVEFFNAAKPGGYFGPGNATHAVSLVRFTQNGTTRFFSAKRDMPGPNIPAPTSGDEEDANWLSTERPAPNLSPLINSIITQRLNYQPVLLVNAQALATAGSLLPGQRYRILGRTNGQLDLLAEALDSFNLAPEAWLLQANGSYQRVRYDLGTDTVTTISYGSGGGGGTAVTAEAEPFTVQAVGAQLVPLPADTKEILQVVVRNAKYGDDVVLPNYPKGIYSLSNGSLSISASAELEKDDVVLVKVLVSTIASPGGGGAFDPSVLGYQIGGTFTVGTTQAVKKDWVYVVGLKWWRALRDMNASAQPVNGANWSLLYNGQQLTDEQLTYVRALLSPIMVTTSSGERRGFNSADELAAYLGSVPLYTVSSVELHELAFSDSVAALDLRYMNVDGKGFTLNVAGAPVQLDQEAQFLTLNGYGNCSLSGRMFRVICHQAARVPAGLSLELRYCEFDSTIVVSNGATLRLLPGTQINLASITKEGTGKVEDLRGTITGTPGAAYTDDDARAANAERFEQNESVLADHEERLDILEQASPEAYVLPTASATVKGGMLVGDGLTVDNTGRVSVIREYTIQRTRLDDRHASISYVGPWAQAARNGAFMATFLNESSTYADHVTAGQDVHLEFTLSFLGIPGEFVAFKGVYNYDGPYRLLDNGEEVFRYEGQPGSAGPVSAGEVLYTLYTTDYALTAGTHTFRLEKLPTPANALYPDPNNGTNKRLFFDGYEVGVAVQTGTNYLTQEQGDARYALKGAAGGGGDTPFTYLKGAPSTGGAFATHTRGAAYKVPLAYALANQAPAGQDIWDEAAGVFDPPVAGLYQGNFGISLDLSGSGLVEGTDFYIAFSDANNADSYLEYQWFQVGAAACDARLVADFPLAAHQKVMAALYVPGMGSIAVRGTASFRLLALT